MLNSLTIQEAAELVAKCDKAITLDVEMRRWGQNLPCVFFHEWNNPCNRLTGYVNTTEKEAIALVEAHNTVVSTLEDWGDDDRRLMMLNVYRGTRSLGVFSTAAEVKRFCERNGYILKAI